MQTETTIRLSHLTTRNDPFGGGLAGSFVLHATIAALLVSWAWITHSGENWGDVHATPGAIQATMVSDIPLPPKPNVDQNSVLATDNPSPAPAPPAPKAIEVPQPDAIPIPAKPTKPAKIAEKTTPAPLPHPQPIQVQPNKVQTGQAAPSIPMASVQNRAGTSTIAAQDAAFGARFPWYVQQVTQKVASRWFTGMLDPRAGGHRASITFQIARDGSPSNISIAQRSGDATLDQTALHAVQEIDTFGPLPDAYGGSHINVTYYFDPPPTP
jgi:protein TonB